jgi:uncharacterized protein YuzB (UPF0349 family)
VVNDGFLLALYNCSHDKYDVTQYGCLLALYKCSHDKYDVVKDGC